MTQAIVGLIGVLVVSAGGLIAWASTPRRMLSFIQHEAETIETLPKDHPGRAVLAEELETSIGAYKAYKANMTERRRFRLSVVALAYAGLGALISAAMKYDWHGFSPRNDIFPRWFLLVGAFSAFAIGMVFFALGLWTFMWRHYMQALGMQVPEGTSPFRSYVEATRRKGQGPKGQ